MHYFLKRDEEHRLVLSDREIGGIDHNKSIVIVAVFSSESRFFFVVYRLKSVKLNTDAVNLIYLSGSELFLMREGIILAVYGYKAVGIF